MAVETMEMVNIIGQMDLVDEVSRQMVLSGSIHPVNAILEMQQNNFPITQAGENVDAVIDYNFIRQYSSARNLAGLESKLNGLYEIFEMKKRFKRGQLKEKYSFIKEDEYIHELYKSVEEKHKNLINLKEELKELDNLQGYIEPIKQYNFNLNEAFNMEYITLKLGELSKHNMERLKKNYENIPSIVFKIHTSLEASKALILVPNSIELEVERILKSLDFKEYKPRNIYNGSPLMWLEEIRSRKKEIQEEIELVKSELSDIKEENETRLEGCYSKLQMEHRVEELKAFMAVTNQFFYLTGWIPRGRKKKLSILLKDYEEQLIVIYKGMSEIREEVSPPTCLKNGRLFKPFESVVRMYGIPSYGELDPTAFVGLTYMLLFGAMFGDVGQGAVLFIIGEILNRIKNRPNLGGVITRLGIGSILFGFLYGSLFGFEDILKTYLVKPMLDINFMLIAAVCLGVVLLSIGYIYSLINAYKKRDLEGGIFSRNGLAGLSFYWLLLYLVIARVYDIKTIVPAGGLVILLILLLIIMLFKEPAAKLIMGIRPLYSESKTDYYIEGGFGAVETLLSLFSNTISFIRVGAFAINHVGLFIAFDTLAHMMGNRVESSLVIIIGNIIIIGLEGLIVFVQGLRLEYYELFSKYFSGAGYEYRPIEI